MDKSVLRKQLITRRSKLAPETVTHASNLISALVCSLSVWKAAKTIAFYIPLKGEVNTWPLIARALDEKKTVSAPVITSSSLAMVFSEFETQNQLLPGPFGLKQPELGRVIDKKNIDLIIVPGLGFTKDGHRLGFGKGYYDRYLKTFKKPALALAYDFQIIGSLPTDDHDQKVNIIITEKNIYPSTYS